MSTGTGTRAAGSADSAAIRDPDGRRVAERRGISSGCRAPRSSRRPSVASAGCDAVDRASRSRARACSTSSSVAASTVRCRSSARRAERVGQRQQDAADLLGFLLLERDDVVVDLDGAERLEKQAGAAGRAAVDDAGNRRAVLGAHDQHVAAVAIGDDLLLQVLRGVLAAQVRLERAAQPRPLLAQPIANALQLRARVVDDLAGRVDLAADVGDLALERRRRRRQSRAGSETCRGRGGRAAQVARSRRGSRPAPGAGSGSSARPSTASASRIASRSAGARSAIGGCRRGNARSRSSRPAPRDTRAARSAAAAAPAAPRQAASARSGGPPRRSDRIRGPSGRRRAWR